VRVWMQGTHAEGPGMERECGLSIPVHIAILQYHLLISQMYGGACACKLHDSLIIVHVRMLSRIERREAPCRAD
jgi:hypothetical protein